MTNVGVYLRLSLSDSDLGYDNKDESNSIENQRLLIRSYIEKNEEFDGKVIEYVDDGYSGANFNRPAFKQMIEDVKKGLIQVIIVKDLSRFGRDYLGVGDYLEQVFPSLGIRFIALNSNYDSKNYIGKTLDLDTSISNLINSMYSKDISKKILTALQTRWKSGINTATFLPYGYRRTEEKKWEIDPISGKVVRTVFELAMEGKRIRDICDYLNERQIPTPAEYIMDKDNSDPRTFKVKCRELRWDKSRIYHILRNYTYTGTAVLGQKRRINIGSRSSKKVGENEWYIIENDHPGIVSKEEYDKALEILNPMKASIRFPQNNPLTGKVICGNCGLKMLYSCSGQEKIYCSHSTNVGKHTNCKKEHYDAKVIEGYVFYYLKQQINIILELSSKVKEQREAGKALYDIEVQKSRQQIKAMDEERIRLYEQYANGHISKEKYIAEKGKLNEEKNKQQERLDSIEAEKQEENDFLFETERMSTRLSHLKSDKRITREIADAYIDSVVINAKDDIEIKFKFEDVILNYLNKASVE